MGAYSDVLFSYEPLQEGEIRLLRLQSLPGHEGDPIECGIEVHRLDAAPEYTALSYFWGSDPPRLLLLLNGEKAQIRGNLFQFLCHAYPGGAPRSDEQTVKASPPQRLSRQLGLLWVDAICLNQSDDDEKTVQLGLMRRIYCSASRIVMWLGPKSEDSDLAMDAWERTARHISMGTAVQFLEFRPNEVRALERLQEREYWRRIWCWPEASTPEVPREIWCGDKKVRFEDAVAANDATRRRILIFDRIPEINPWIPELGDIWRLERTRRQAMRWQSGCGRDGSQDTQLSSMTDGPILTGAGAGSGSSTTQSVMLETIRSENMLIDLLYTAKNILATDPRDRIYAHLPLYEDIHGRPDIRVDYRLSPDDVFQDAAQFMYKTEGDLRALLFCNRALPFQSNLSWVPHPRRLAASEFVNFYNCCRHFRADGGRGGGGAQMAAVAHVEVSRQRQTIGIRGVRVAVVRETMEPLMSGTHGGGSGGGRDAHATSRGGQTDGERPSSDLAFWRPRFERWFAAVAIHLFPLGAEREYVGGGTLSAAADRLLALDFCPGLVWERTGKVAHWPLLETASALARGGARPPGIADGEEFGSMFADLLLRTGHAALFRTGMGYVGLGPPGVGDGDVVAVLHGLAIPMVLRRLHQELWQVVGPCFVVGFMDGEAMEGGRRPAEVFEIM